MAVNGIGSRHPAIAADRGSSLGAGGVWRTGDHLDGCDESIPLARNGLHERGSIRRIAKSLPDFADRGVDAGLDVNEDVFAPQPLDDVAAGDELTSTLDQQDQEVHRLPFEFHRASLPAQLVRRDIELEVAEAEGLARIGRLHRRLIEQLLHCHKSRIRLPLGVSGRFQLFSRF